MPVADKGKRLEWWLQERLLAALALCSCDSAGLNRLGGGALLQALHDSTYAARKPTVRESILTSLLHIPSCCPAA